MDVQTLIDAAGGVEQLAAIADVSRQRVHDWKRLGAIPGSRVPAICDKLKIAADELLPLIERPKPQSERKARGAAQGEAA